MEKQNIQTQFDWKNVRNNLTRLVFSFGVFSLFVGLAAVMLTRQGVETNQDIRQQASIEDGPVTVSSLTSNGSNTFSVGEEVSIDLLINTQGVETAGIQTVFNIITDTLNSDITVSPHNDAGLISEVNELQEVSDGFLVTNFSRPSLGTPLSTQTATKFLTITFTSQDPGQITINFDTEKSKSPLFGSNPPQEQLTHIPVMTFTVEGEGTTSPSPSASTEATATPTPRPIGGLSYTSCNAVCSSNNQCPVNHRCYDTGSEKRCRLVTNLSSVTCEGVPDQGISRSCNQYCADSNECADGLTCWYNQCRHESNVDNVSCTPPTQTVLNTIQQQCNTRCNSNNDCPINMACFNSQCRLAANMSSSSCSPRTAPTVSVIYTVPKGGSQANKGETQNSGQQAGQPANSPRGSVRPSTSASPSASATVSASVRPSFSPSTRSNEFGSFFNASESDTSALDSLTSSLQAYSEQLGIESMLLLRYIAIGIVGLLIIWWFIALFSGYGKKNYNGAVGPMSGTKAPTGGQIPQGLRSAGTAGTTPPPKPTFNNPGLTAAPITPYKPQQTEPAKPVVGKIEPTPQVGKIEEKKPESPKTDDTPKETKSSMVSKLQAKGVETPK